MTFNMSYKARLFGLALLFCLLLLCVAISLTTGEYNASVLKILDVLYYKFTNIPNDTISKMDQIVIFDVRLPRIITAMIIGFALSISGAIYQACFKNPLVEPFILGASSGAAFGASVAIVFLFSSVFLIAFCFSILAVFVSYLLAKNKKIVPIVGLILSGVIVGSIFSSGVAVIKYISEDAQLREITFWIMGGLYYAKWENVSELFVVCFPCFIIVFLLAWKLNLLSLGDEQAKSLGINPERYKLTFIILATIMTAICVANVGIIAWIGLIMPHVARLIVGPDNRWLLPFAGILGALYLLICDTLARSITHSEVPVGIITSLVGAPFLVVLLRSRAKELLK